MKYFYLILLFPFSLFAQNSQPWKAKLDSASLYQKAEKYDKAIANLEEAKSMMEKVDSVRTEGYVTMLSNLGELRIHDGRYSLAEEYFKKAIEIQEKRTGNIYIECLSIASKDASLYFCADRTDLAWLYGRLNYTYLNNEKANLSIPFFQEMLIEKEKVIGKANLSYISTYSDLAYSHTFAMNYKKADSLYNVLLPLEAKILGRNTEQYMTDLRKASISAMMTGQYDKAEKYLEEAMDICKSIFNDDCTRYGMILNHYAMLAQSNFNKIPKTIGFLEKTIAIQERNWGSRSILTAAPMNQLGTLYIMVDDFYNAEKYLSASLKLFENIWGKDHIRTLVGYMNLSGLYYKMGEYDKGIDIMERMAVINKAKTGEKNHQYAQIINMLASSYIGKGEYKEAIPLLEKSSQILEQTVGKKQNDYLSAIHNIAHIYNLLGDYQKAATLQKEILDIRKEMNTNNYFYALALNNLSISYLNLGKKTEAKRHLMEAIQITKNEAMQTGNVALFMVNLGGVLTREKEYDLVDSLFEKAIVICEKKLKNNPEYGKILNAIASSYFKRGNKILTAQYLKKALTILSASFDKNHPELATTNFNFACLYLATNQPDSAQYYLNQAVPAQNNHISQTFSFTSERQQTEYLKSQQQNIDLPFVLASKISDPAFLALSCDLSLLVKGLSLQTGTQLRQSVVNAGDSVAIQLLEQLNALKASLNAQYQKPLEKRFRVAELEQEAETTEKKLMSQSSAFREAMQGLNANWKNIQAKLKPEEAAIEWVRYRHFDKDQTDSTIYAAFIIRPNVSSPKYVVACSASELDALFAKLNDSLITVRRFYSKSSTLYDLVWSPLVQYLQGVKTIYVSPVGGLHRIAFSAITMPNQKTLSEQYNIQIVSHLRILLLPQKSSELPIEAALFGGIDYEKTAQQASIASTNSVFNSRYISKLQSQERSDSRGGAWSFLPGTNKEVMFLNSLLSKTKIKTNIFRAENATETAFKNLSGKQIGLIHVATHGFALKPTTDDKNTSLLANPLLKSGLVFAGANRSFLDTTYHNNQEEDGVLTAYELAQLNLQGTELAVLSACESGLGDIRGAEGVYGLQRGFKLAGVKKLLMSLWKVNDAAAAEWMQTFYGEWINKKSIRQAYQLTQKTMRQRYNQKPEVWAAFVLVE